MGNSFSMVPSCGLDHQKQILDGGGSAEKLLYKWKIEGFSSLPNLRLGPSTPGKFEYKGYYWFLAMKTTKSLYGKEQICLRLSISYMPSGPEVKAEYSLWIYNQKHGKHIMKSGTSSFKAKFYPRYQNMISLETFKDASSGFLVNDSCIFGVEIRRVHTPKISESLYVFKGSSHVLYTWKIDCGPKLQRPHGSSEAFDVGGVMWNILVHPCVGMENEYLSIFLQLDDGSVALVGSGASVEFSLSLKDQIDGKDRKFAKQEVFDSSETISGWSQFLSYEDLYDASKGFLVDNTCIVEASITLVGALSCPF